MMDAMRVNLLDEDNIVSSLCRHLCLINGSTPLGAEKRGGPLEFSLLSEFAFALSIIFIEAPIKIVKVKIFCIRHNETKARCQ
jgi:hypothetical protein